MYKSVREEASQILGNRPLGVVGRTGSQS